MKRHRPRPDRDPDITYRSLAEGEYAATKFGVTITVCKRWDSKGIGYWWECPETGMRSSSRDQCARASFMKLHEVPS